MVNSITCKAALACFVLLCGFNIGLQAANHGSAQKKNHDLDADRVEQEARGIDSPGQGLRVENDMKQFQENDDPYRREMEFWGQRAYPFDKIPDGALDRAVAKQKSMLQRKGAAALMSASPEWKSIGPGNIGGRTRSVVCDPKKDGWVYTAAAGGGVWRSTDHGASWTALFDSQNSLCMGALAIDPNNSDILYAATGEMAPASPISDGWGTGIYKSTDAGATWHLLGLTTVGAFSKIYVHPLNSNILYAGGVRSGSGLYRSNDAGHTWTRLNRLAITDISLNPADSNELVLGISGQGVYYSNDGGQTITSRSSGFPSSMGRVSVQLCPSNPSRWYCLIEGPYSGDTTRFSGYVYVSNDKGNSWTARMQDDLSIFGSNFQGYYDNFVITHPTNPNIAFIAGIDFYQTTNGGSTWSNISQSYSGGGVHPDQQCGCFNPLNPDEIYVGNDGGMFRRASANDDFLAVNNGYAVTAYYAMDIDHSADNKTYGGSQDNGTTGSTTDSQDWRGVLGGDGFYVAVNPLNPNIIYCENYNGSLKVVNLASGFANVDTLGIPASDPSGDWSSPIFMDRENAIVYCGRKALYIKAAGTAGWSPYSPKLDTSSFISAIGASVIDDQLCFVGYANGSLYATSDGGVKWRNVSLNGLPKRFVRDIIPTHDQSHTTVAWACFSGYGTGHVFRTDDAGLHWTDISGSLPDVPVNALSVYRNNEKIIFAGTDIGVFATYNGGESWFPYGKGLPRAPVEDMQIFEEKGVLRIATHGRSMWEVSIPSEEITEPEITAPTGGDVVMATASMVFSWHGFNGPVRVDISYDTLNQYWVRLASGVVSNVMSTVIENRPTGFARIRVTQESDTTISLVSNSFTILEFQRGSVKSTQSFSHVAYGLSYDGNNGLWTTSFYTGELFKLDATTLLIQKSVPMPTGYTGNFTDMAMDRSSGTFYIHHLNTTNNGSGSKILVIDTSGNLLRTLISPASYGIGLEYLNGQLIVGERDGLQYVYFCNPESGDIIKSYPNCFEKFYGPRCMSLDGNGDLLQVGTDFGSGSGLVGAYLSKFSVSNPSKELDEMELINATGSEINARGVEYDPRDKNYWITDLSGNIFKIANFDTPSNPLSDVQQNPEIPTGLSISPNPSHEHAFIRYTMTQAQAHVRIDVYSLLGERMVTLVDGMKTLDDNNNVILDTHEMPAGMYSVVLSIDGRSNPAEKFVVTH